MSSPSIRFSNAIGAFEAEIERLAAAQAQAVLARFNSYRLGNVPPAALIESGRHNVRQVARILRDGRVPERNTIDEVRRTRDRANQGVPPEELHDAYRLCLRILGEAFVASARAARVAQADVLAANSLLWESADVLTSAVVVARQAADLDRSRHNRAQRQEFLRALLFGAAAPALIRDHAAAFGLPGDRSYYAVRARAAPGTPSGELANRLAAASRSYGCRPLIDSLDGDVVGVVPVKPVLGDTRHSVGIGGPLALEAMPRAFATASRMLDVARGFDLSGCFELADLSLYVAVAAEPELGAALVERYLLPLHQEGDYGAELENTIRVHLEGGARVNETAARLELHPNSVRHRLARFESLTGARLETLPVQFEIWWALAWLRHERRSTRGD